MTTVPRYAATPKVTSTSNTTGQEDDALDDAGESPSAIIQTASPMPVDVARRFARALDMDDWDTATACLAADCEYAFRGKVTRRRGTIVGSYRTLGEWVKATFESVRYESAVEKLDAHRALISFRDLLDHQGHHLDFRCQQLITLGAAGTIIHIEHIDLPGEPEKVEPFNAACGVTKPEVSL